MKIYKKLMLLKKEVYKIIDEPDDFSRYSYDIVRSLTNKIIKEVVKNIIKKEV